MGFASSGQEEAEGWGGLALGKEVWVGGLCLWWSREMDGVVLALRMKRWKDGVCLAKQKQGMGCACGGQEDMEGWVCLFLTRRCS